MTFQTEWKVAWQQNQSVPSGPWDACHLVGQVRNLGQNHKSVTLADNF